MFGETAEGWLSKTGILGLSSTRHRRYFVLSGNELRYYKHMSDARPTGLIDLKHYSSAEKDSGKQHPHGLRIVSQCKHHRSYIFYADHEQGCQYWIDAINATLDPFVGRHHACDLPCVSIPDEPYSVLDKWLNRLDLSDNHTSRTPTLETSTTTLSKTNTAGPYMSPNLRPSRQSLESLDSLPSETTLSSSTGSRAHSSMGQNTIYIPSSYNGNSQQSQFQTIMSPPKQYKASTTASSPPLNSNRNSFVSRSLSTIKNQQSIRYNQQQQEQQYQGDTVKSPTWSINSMATSITSSTVNNSSSIKLPTIYHRKDWEADDLFDFEDDMVTDSSKWYTDRPLPSTP